MSLRIFFLAVMSILFFLSCEDNDIKTEEKPIIALLNQPGLVIDTGQTAVQWIYGFSFSTTKDGKIKGLGMKLPTKGSYLVRLWNLDDDTLLKEETLTAITDHEVVYNTIPDIAIQKNIQLGVTIQAGSFYKIRKTDNSDFTFPLQSGNIRLLSFRESKVSENILGRFPTMIKSDEISPCIDVIFLED